VQPGEVPLDRVAYPAGLGYGCAAPRGDYPAVFDDDHGVLNGITARPIDEPASPQG
jgi:hypothetical protein